MRQQLPYPRQQTSRLLEYCSDSEQVNRDRRPSIARWGFGYGDRLSIQFAQTQFAQMQIAQAIGAGMVCLAPGHLPTHRRDLSLAGQQLDGQDPPGQRSGRYSVAVPA